MLLTQPNQLTDEQFQALAGKRCKLVHMSDDPNPIEQGATGTINLIGPLQNHSPIVPHGHEWRQIGVKWDNGRSLLVILPPDQIELIDPPAEGV